MTYNTGNPVPSNHPYDFSDNEEFIDTFVNSASLTATNRAGATKKTISGIIDEYDSIAATALAAQVAAESAAAESVAASEVATLSTGIYPTTAAALSKGVMSISGIVVGSGGTDGTFSIIFSGGAGTGAAGTFNVVSGSITSISVTARGNGYTSAPSVSFANSAGLTGASATATIANNTDDGEYFSIPSGTSTEYLILYRNANTRGLPRAFGQIYGGCHRCVICRVFIVSRKKIKL